MRLRPTRCNERGNFEYVKMIGGNNTLRTCIHTNLQELEHGEMLQELVFTSITKHLKSMESTLQHPRQ